MKLLLTLDEKDYTEDMPVFEKYTVRAIICNGDKFIMQRSRAGEYKIPGGGVEEGESYIETIIREVREEVGLIVKPESITEIGEILEIREDRMCKGQKYVCHSLFYRCEIEEETVPTEMTFSEIEKGFEPVWERLEKIVERNDEIQKENWMKRDTEFLRLLLENKIEL